MVMAIDIVYFTYSDGIHIHIFIINMKKCKKKNHKFLAADDSSIMKHGVQHKMLFQPGSL